MQDGMITFSDLVGKLKVLRVDCDKCGRHGRYLVDKLIYDHGPEVKLIEWFNKVTRDCPQKHENGVVQACEAVMPDLSGLEM